MLTTVLEVLGLALLVAAAFIVAGPGVAVFVAGGCCLYSAWAITRASRR
jgi:hypothetical protein